MLNSGRAMRHTHQIFSQSCDPSPFPHMTQTADWLHVISMPLNFQMVSSPSTPRGSTGTWLQMHEYDSRPVNNGNATMLSISQPQNSPFLDGSIHTIWGSWDKALRYNKSSLNKKNIAVSCASSLVISFLLPNTHILVQPVNFSVCTMGLRQS